MSRIRPAGRPPRVFSDGLRRRAKSRFCDCLLARRPIPWRPFVAPLRRAIPRLRENVGEAGRWAGVVSSQVSIGVRTGRPLPSGV